MKHPLLALFISTFACLSASPALAAQTDALPSLIQNAGWPLDAKGIVRDMQAVRLSGSLEAEQAILIDDVLYLAFRPGRYSEFVQLASGVQSMQVVPNTDGSQSLVIAQAGGLHTLHWDWTQAGYAVINPLPGELNAWDGVEKMWVQESAGVQFLYGHDSGAGKVRRAQHSSGVWTSLVSLPCQGALRDMAFVELDSTSPGEEMVWLEKYTLSVMTADGALVLDKESVQATDSIAVLRDPSVATADLLVHSYVDGGAHMVRVWNESQSSPGFSLGGVDCTAILPRKGGLYGDHLLLTRGGQGDVDVLEIHGSSGSGGLVLEWNSAGGWIDTHEDVEQRPVQGAGLVDLDLDGFEDLMVVVLNGNTLQLRNVMTEDLDDQRWTGLELDEPSLQSLSNGDFELKVTMQVPAVFTSSTVQVDMWARSDPGTAQETLIALGRQWVTITAGATEHEFTQVFSAVGWDPMQAHIAMGFAPVNLDSNGEVTHIFPSQGLAWAAPNASSAVVDDDAGWVNTNMSVGNPPRMRRRRSSRPVLPPTPPAIVQ